MTPRRKAWLLVAALGIAGLGVVCTSRNIVVWRDIYEAVAYRENLDDDLGFVYLEKRAAWLPGDVLVAPDQECSPCLEGTHIYCCSAVMSVYVEHPFRGGTEPRPFPTVCTCNHSSHLGE